ncbi:unnamed protein product [Urochloa humidicola]
MYVEGIIYMERKFLRLVRFPWLSMAKQFWLLGQGVFYHWKKWGTQRGLRKWSDCKSCTKWRVLRLSSLSVMLKNRKFPSSFTIVYALPASAAAMIRELIGLALW